MRSTHSGAARNIVTTYAARLSSIVGTLILIPVVANAVGIEAFGLYALLASMGVLFSQDLGLAATTTRFVAAGIVQRNDMRVREVALASSWLFAIVGLGIAALTGLAFWIIIRSIETPANVNVFALSLLAVSNVAIGLGASSSRWVVAGMGRMDITNAIQIAQSLLRVAATVLILQWKADVVLVATVDLTVTLLAMGSYWLTKRALLGRSRGRFLPTWHVLRELMVFGSALLIMTVAGVIVLQSGSVIASLLLSLPAVAAYTAANRAFLLVRETTNSLSTALLPLATANAATKADDKNRQLYVEGTRYVNAAMVIIVVPMLVFTEPLITAWVGPQFTAATTAAQVLVISMLANNNHLLAIPILTGMAKVRFYAFLHAVWAVAGVIAACALARPLGTLGVALGLSAPIILLEPLYVAYALRVLRIPKVRFLRRSVLTPLALASLPTALFIAIATRVSPNGVLDVAVLTTCWVVFMSIVFAFTLPGRNARSRLFAALRL